MIGAAVVGQYFSGYEASAQFQPKIKLNIPTLQAQTQGYPRSPRTSHPASKMVQGPIKSAFGMASSQLTQVNSS